MPGVERPELRRALGIVSTIALTVSDISPLTALLVVCPVIIQTAGLASFWVYAGSAVIALCMALCMAELGSMYPGAGGLYTVVACVLGRPWGFIALLNYLAQAVILPAVVALGIGTYLNVLFPSMNTNLAAFVTMIAVTMTAVLAVSANARLTAVCLAIELSVVATVAVAGFLHAHQSPGALLHPVATAAAGGQTTLGSGVILSAVATALFAYNGYDSAINFSEESTGSAANVGQAVVRAALIGIVFAMVPATGVLLAAPDIATLMNSSAPISYVITRVLGSTFNTIATAAGILAVFNAARSVTLQFSRIVYSSGRDRAWPVPISAALARVHPRFGSPWVATLLVGGLASLLTFLSNLGSVVTFTSVLIIFLYALVAFAALVSRLRHRGVVRPYRMPLWPLPPLVAMIGVVIALWQQSARDLLICAAIFAAGGFYYLAFLRSRSATHWEARPKTDY